MVLVKSKTPNVILERHKYFDSATPTQRQRLSSEMYAERTWNDSFLRTYYATDAKRMSMVSSDIFFYAIHTPQVLRVTPRLRIMLTRTYRLRITFA